MKLSARAARAKAMREAVMDCIGGYIDRNDPDLFPPVTPNSRALRDDMKDRGWLGAQSIEWVVLDLIKDGLLAYSISHRTNRNRSIVLTSKGVYYLYHRGYLRRYFKLPAGSNDPQQKVFALGGAP